MTPAVHATDTGQIPRPRLTEAILATPLGGVAMLTAPVGFGAKVAMAQALDRSGEPAHWLPCPSSPADSAEWRVIEAVARELAGGWLVLTGITRAHDADPPLRAVISKLSTHGRLALLAHTNLTGLVMSTPHAVLLEREELAFTDDEAGALLLERASAADPQEIAAITQLCAGWAAALALAADRLRRSRPGETQRWLVGRGATLITDAWWCGLSETTAQFLTDTALLDDLQPDLCQAVLASSESGDQQPSREQPGDGNRVGNSAASILCELELHEPLLSRAVVVGVPDPVWHRHPLLTWALRARGVADATNLTAHARAATWYRDRGCVEPALHHLLSAGRHAEAAAYLREHEGDLFASGSAEQVLEWYQRLPGEAWGARAQHLLRLAWGRLLSGDSAGARDALANLSAVIDLAEVEVAKRHLAERDIADIGTTDEQSDSVALLRGEMNFLAGYLAGRAGDPAKMVIRAQQACELFGSGGTADSHVLAPVLLARGLVWSGRLVSALRVLEDTDPLRFTHGFLREVSLAGVRALCELQQGRIVHARSSLQGGRRWLRHTGDDPLSTPQFTFANSEANLALESGECGQAIKLAGQVEAAAVAFDDVGEATIARIIQARAAYFLGDLAAARTTLAFARSELAARTPESDLGLWLDTVEFGCLIRAGASAQAEALLSRWLPSGRRTLLAARLTAVRKPAQTVRALSALRPQTVRGAATRHLLLALANRQLNSRLAEAQVAEAVRIIAENGLVMLPQEFPDLRDVADRVAAHMGTSALPEEQTPTTPEHGRGALQLSAGELALLTLLPERMTYGQLAEQLDVSVNTLKTRLQRLYRKLGVGKRDEAIAEARRLGIIAGPRPWPQRW